MASIQSNLAKYFIRQLRQRSLHYLNNLSLLRVEQDKALSRIRPPKNVNFQTIAFPKFAAEWSIPSTAYGLKHPEKVIIYMHGGGYAVGSAISHRGLVGKIVAETGIKALSLDYRLAPEHPFPAALEDSVSAYVWLLEKEGYDPKDIILMGDSAGGGLTLSTLLKLKEIGLPQPLAAAVISPWTDLSFSGDSIETHQDKDPLLLTDHAKKWAAWYHQDLNPAHPHISPLFGDYSNIAPILIQVGTEEILLSDSLRMISNAKKFNAEIHVDIWDGMFHVWHFGWPYLPESRDAILKIVNFLEAQISADRVTNKNKIKPLVKEAADSEQNQLNFWLRFGSDVIKNFWDYKK
jgi:epsilon-lactone hydrolase